MIDDRMKDLLGTLAATAPTPQTPLGRPAERPSSRAVPVLVGAATVAAVLVGAGAVALVGHPRSEPAARAPMVDTRAGARAEALQAARTFIDTFFTIDYHDTDRYSRTIENLSTGRFHADFAGKTSELNQAVTQVRTLSHGSVLAAAARNVTPTTADVLLVANQTATNHASRTPVTTRYRVETSLQKVGDRWLVRDFAPAGLVQGGDCTDSSATPAAAAALSQGCADVARVFSSDYRTLDADLAAQRSVTTGAFREELAKENAPSSIRMTYQTSHVVVRARPIDAALVSSDAAHAELLVFLDQSVSNTSLTSPRTDRNRLQVQLTRVDGRWLISGTTAL